MVAYPIQKKPIDDQRVRWTDVAGRLFIDFLAVDAGRHAQVLLEGAGEGNDALIAHCLTNFFNAFCAVLQ